MNSFQLRYISLCFMFATTNVLAENSESQNDKHLFEYMYFGGGHASSGNIPIPTGDATITGRFTFRDEPASGVHFDAVLNNRYQAFDVITDENGLFWIPTEPGQWELNTIVVRSWDNKPDASDYMVLNGHENFLKRNYTKYTFSNDEGLPLELHSGSGINSLNFTITPRISLYWPERKPGSHSEPSIADPYIDIIRWGKVDDAHQYRLVVRILELAGSGSYRRDAAIRVLGDVNSYPLSEIGHYKRDGVNEVYIVKVQAFDKDGRFLSETREHSRANDIAFRLKDGLLLRRDDHSEYPGESIEHNHNKKVLDAKDRYNATILMIKSKMYNEAHKMLDTIDGNLLRPTEKMALEIYLYAASGRCVEADAVRMNMLQKYLRNGHIRIYSPAERYDECIQSD